MISLSSKRENWFGKWRRLGVRSPIIVRNVYGECRRLIEEQWKFLIFANYKSEIAIMIAITILHVKFPQNF